MSGFFDQQYSTHQLWAVQLIILSSVAIALDKFPKFRSAPARKNEWFSRWLTGGDAKFSLPISCPAITLERMRTHSACTVPNVSESGCDYHTRQFPILHQPRVQLLLACRSRWTSPPSSARLLREQNNTFRTQQNPSIPLRCRQCRNPGNRPSRRSMVLPRTSSR